MTSFAGTPIKTHLKSKGITARTGAAAALRAGYLRVVTASKPHAKDALKLQNGKGMKRDYSYVNYKDTYTVSLGTLARYGCGNEGVDGFVVASHAVKVLLEDVERRAGGKKRVL